MKHIIKYFVNFIKKSKTEVCETAATSVKLINPIIHNTQKSMDIFYSDSENLKVLSSNDQFIFYEEVIGLLKKIDHDYSDIEVADFGCGIGGLLEAFQKLYPSNKLFGYDFSTEAIRIAKTNMPNASFAVCDFMEEQLNKNFDIIFCTEVLEHMLNPKEFIRNISKNIKEKGLMIFTVPDGRQDTFYGHINFWSPESWLIFLEEIFPSENIEVGPLDKGRTMFGLIKFCK